MRDAKRPSEPAGTERSQTHNLLRYENTRIAKPSKVPKRRASIESGLPARFVKRVDRGTQNVSFTKNNRLRLGRYRHGYRAIAAGQPKIK